MNRANTSPGWTIGAAELWFWLSTGLLLALVAAPLVTAVDLMVTVSHQTVGAWAPGAFPLALGLVVFFGGVLSLLFSIPVGLAWRIAARGNQHDTRHLALMVAVTLPLLAGSAAVLFGAFASITEPHLRSLLFVTALVLSGGVCLFAGWAVANFTSILLDRLEPRSTGWVVSFLVGACIALDLVLWVTFRRAMPSGVWLTGTAFFILVALGLLVGGWLFPWLGRLAGSLLFNARFRAFLWAAPLASLLLSQVVVSLDGGSARYLAARGGLSGHLVVTGRRFLDLDGDGASWALGGGDCDDFDGTRHPLAMDVPANGVDEDCDGRDRPALDVLENADPFVLGKGPREKFNVIVLCVDALRFDHTGFGGYARNTTPRLDELAAKSWVFEQAIAPSSTTRETIPALLSGKYPSGIHWMKGPKINQLAPDEKLLPAMLRGRGYQTIGLVDEWLRRFLPSFRRGFDQYEVPYGNMKWHLFGQKAAPYTTFRAIQLLSRLRSPKPFFMYLQYEAPHHPYVRHEGIPSFGNRPMDLYDHEIAYADHFVGILMDFLDFANLSERTIVVVFGDHGEEFLEHGGERHSRTVHRESVHVALLVHVPGREPVRISERVSLVDVFPTLLDLLGFPEDGRETQGLSLLYPVSEDRETPVRPIYSELMVNHEGPVKFRKAVYFGDHKLMWDMASDEVTLYDVRKDPGETSPLDLPAVQRDLFQRLKTFVSLGNHK